MDLYDRDAITRQLATARGALRRAVSDVGSHHEECRALRASIARLEDDLASCAPSSSPGLSAARDFTPGTFPPKGGL